jgi:hypothetical protein
MVTMISTGMSLAFTSVALLTKHEHWSLQGEEAKALAEAINSALDTLPAKYYEKITGFVESWVPWINLSFVCGAIIIPRIEESFKRAEAGNYKAPDERAKRPEPRRAAPDNFDGWTSLGGP